MPYGNALEEAPSRLGSIPTQSVPNFAAPAALPYGDLVKQAGDQLSKVVDALSPLGQAERRAKIEQLMATTAIYHKAAAGDPQAQAWLFGKATDHVLSTGQIAANAEARERGRRRGMGPAPTNPYTEAVKQQGGGVGQPVKIVHPPQFQAGELESEKQKLDDGMKDINVGLGSNRLPPPNVTIGAPVPPNPFNS